MYTSSFLFENIIQLTLLGMHQCSHDTCTCSIVHLICVRMDWCTVADHQKLFSQ